MGEVCDRREKTKNSSVYLSCHNSRSYIMGISREILDKIKTEVEQTILPTPFDLFINHRRQPEIIYRDLFIYNIYRFFGLTHRQLSEWCGREHSTVYDMIMTGEHFMKTRYSPVGFAISRYLYQNYREHYAPPIRGRFAYLIQDTGKRSKSYISQKQHLASDPKETLCGLSAKIDSLSSPRGTQ